MARIQILELPTIYREHGGDETPFAVVIDQVHNIEAMAGMDGVREQLGARAILVFEEPVEIPANEVPVGPDGYPVRLQVEGDFDKFREQVRAEIAKAQAGVAEALRAARRA